MDYKSSPKEKKARLFLAHLGIDYEAIAMEQFANRIEVLKLSKHMNSLISQHDKRRDKFQQFEKNTVLLVMDI